LGTSYVPTSAAKAFKNIQYYQQTAYGAQDPDPQLINAGFVSDFNSTRAVQHKETRVLGSRRQYSDRKQMIEGTVSVTTELLGTPNLYKYATTDPPSSGSVANTCDSPITFLESRRVNGNERYRIFKDCLPQTARINIQKDITVTIDYFCPDVGDPNNPKNWLTEAQLKTIWQIGTGTIDYAGALSGEPINHLDSNINNTGSPFQMNGEDFDLNTLSVDCANNVTPLAPSGWSKTKHAAAGNKVVTGNLVLWVDGSNTVEDFVENFTSLTLTYLLKDASPDIILTVEGAKLNNRSEGVSSGANEYSTMALPFTANNVDMT
jgi:Phage tail tube protein